MSRENKFRAWDARHYEMVYSDKEDAFYINTKGAMMMYRMPKSESGLETKYVYNYDLMQYTGLKDKNGVEIYEGDIDIGRLIVTYVGDLEGSLGMACGWYLQSGDFDRFTELLCETGLEVIGNIYENPELLEVENE